jgi:hypothetical protein
MRKARKEVAIELQECEKPARSCKKLERVVELPAELVQVAKLVQVARHLV